MHFRTFFGGSPMLKTVKHGSGIRVDPPPPLFFQNSHIFPFFFFGSVPYVRQQHGVMDNGYEHMAKKQFSKLYDKNIPDDYVWPLRRRCQWWWSTFASRGCALVRLLVGERGRLLRRRRRRRRRDTLRWGVRRGRAEKSQCTHTGTSVSTRHQDRVKSFEKVICSSKSFPGKLWH